MRWDIFCQIIDNFGDAGVCWRLARAVASHHIPIRLYCDQIETLDKLSLSGSIVRDGKDLGIEIQPWSKASQNASSDDIGSVVIETFGCHLPDDYIEGLIRQQKHHQQALWINLEYLSAEPWAEASHLLPSPQTNGLAKYFYFPGFTDQAGGLTFGDWEQATERNTPASLLPYWKTEGPNLALSIFQYPHTSIQEWLIDLADISPHPVKAYVFQHHTTLENLESPHRNIELIQLPFLPQQDYDWLLAHCDLNLVRGEDSFVRAQWAGKPFLWDIYYQGDQAHQVKQKAFWDLFISEVHPSDPISVNSFIARQSPKLWWNAWSQLQNHAKKWSEILRTRKPLEVKIVDFVTSQEKH